MEFKSIQRYNVNNAEKERKFLKSSNKSMYIADKN